MIKYKTKPLLRKCITEYIRNRLLAKRAGDKVGDLAWKTRGNATFGKFSQKLNLGTIYGTYLLILEEILNLHILYEELEITSILPVISSQSELFEVQYLYEYLDIFQVGMLKRIASYITAIGRTNYFRMVLHLDSLYDEGLRLAYGDTDSNFIDMEAGFSEELKRYLELIFDMSRTHTANVDIVNSARKKLKKYETLVAEGLITDVEYAQQIIEDSKELIADVCRGYGLEEDYDKLKEYLRVEVFKDLMLKVRECYKLNSIYQKIILIKDFDIRYSESLYDNKVKLEHPDLAIIDDNVLGCYKIEKFIKEGYFLGSKMYAVLCLDVDKVGRLANKCKMKGVAELYRQFEHYKQLWTSIYDLNSPFDVTNAELISNYARHYKIETIFVRLHTGIRISSMLKIIIPTLVKRRMTDKQGLESVPFRDFKEQ